MRELGKKVNVRRVWFEERMEWDGNILIELAREWDKHTCSVCLVQKVQEIFSIAGRETEISDPEGISYEGGSGKE